MSNEIQTSSESGETSDESKFVGYDESGMAIYENVAGI